MFSKKQRLTKKAFDTVFKQGKRVHSPTLQLIYQKSDNFRCAVVVGKKVYRKAVDRNRLRRRMYGVLYRYQKEHTLHGVFVVIAKPPLKDVPKDVFADEIVKALSQVR